MPQMQERKAPEEIARQIVDWFPDGSFTFDTWRKLQRDIAAAIRKEREKT